MRFSDVGWSCITATTAVAAVVLDGLGYEADATVLSVPVTFNLTSPTSSLCIGENFPTRRSTAICSRSTMGLTA